MASNIMNEMESLTNTPPAAAAAVPHPSAPSPLGATAQKIVQACGLADTLGQSVCLRCASSVLAQDSKMRATLYCSALFRDLEVSITECTAFQEPQEPLQYIGADPTAAWGPSIR